MLADSALAEFAISEAPFTALLLARTVCLDVRLSTPLALSPGAALAFDTLPGAQGLDLIPASAGPLALGLRTAVSFSLSIADEVCHE